MTAGHVDAAVFCCGCCGVIVIIIGDIEGVGNYG